MTGTAIVSQQQGAVQPLPTMGELVEKFLASVDVAASSRATYRRQLRKFLSWLESSLVDGLTRMERLEQRLFDLEDVLAYRDGLQAEGLSTYSVNGYLTAVRKLFQFLEAKRAYPDVSKVKGLKKPRGYRKDTFTQEQLREILAGIDRSSQDGLRDYAILNLMARTGLRDVEVSRARIGDIRQEAGYPVLWVQGKGRDSKDDFVLLTPEAYKPIKAYLRARGTRREAAPLFSSSSDRNAGQPLSTRSISRIAKGAFRRAGLDSRQMTAHSLRHTAITLAIMGGASLHQAQAMARHSDPSTTMTYFHNLARVEAGAEKCISF